MGPTLLVDALDRDDIRGLELGIASTAPADDIAAGKNRDRRENAAVAQQETRVLHSERVLGPGRDLGEHPIW